MANNSITGNHELGPRGSYLFAAARACATIFLARVIKVGAWYGMPSLMVHSTPPVCTQLPSRAFSE